MLGAGAEQQGVPLPQRRALALAQGRPLPAQHKEEFVGHGVDVGRRLAADVEDLDHADVAEIPLRREQQGEIVGVRGRDAERLDLHRAALDGPAHQPASGAS